MTMRGPTNESLSEMFAPEGRRQAIEAERKKQRRRLWLRRRITRLRHPFRG